MIIKVLGSGCSKCKKLEKMVKKVLREENMQAQIEKVEDYSEILAYGVLTTPAIVIDEKLVSQGKLLNSKEIKELLFLD